MVSPFYSFGVNIVAKALVDGPYSAFNLAIGLVMVGGRHIDINRDIGHKLHPEVGGESGVSMRVDRGRETVDRKDWFEEDR